MKISALLSQRIFRGITVALYLVFFYGVSTAHAAGSSLLDDVPVPPQATLEVISEEFQHNGQALLIARLVTSANYQTSLDFYRSAWESASDSEIPGYVEREYENWVAISRLRNGTNTVVQFDKSSLSSDPASGAALISVMNLEQRVVASFNALSHPGDAELLSSTRTNDIGRDSTVEVIKTSMAMGSSREYYRSKMRRDGWNLVSDRSALDSMVMLFNRKSEKIEIVLNPSNDGSTLIVINQVIYGG